MEAAAEFPTLPGSGFKYGRQLTDQQRARHRETSRAWAERNKDRVRAAKRAYYQKHKARFQAYERDRQYRKMYGITLADYEKLLREQGGRCGICKEESAGRKGGNFCVDHCHATGRVRGLLCIKCNSRLGWYEPLKLVVADYLAGKHKAPSRSQRYRLKDLDAYRTRKNAYGKTPEQREKKKLYARKWRALNADHCNAYARARKATLK